jgi:hypothetical protein
MRNNQSYSSVLIIGRPDGEAVIKQTKDEFESRGVRVIISTDSSTDYSIEQLSESVVVLVVSADLAADERVKALVRSLREEDVPLGIRRIIPVDAGALEDRSFKRLLGREISPLHFIDTPEGVLKPIDRLIEHLKIQRTFDSEGKPPGFRK